MNTPLTDTHIRVRNELGYNVDPADATHMRTLETLHGQAFRRWQTAEEARGRIEDERNAAVETLSRKAENNFGLDRRNKRLTTAIKTFLSEWDWMDGPEGWKDAVQALRDSLDSQNAEHSQPEP